MSPERAKALLAMARDHYGEIPRAFRKPSDTAGKQLASDGMTEAEDRHVRLVWSTMPSPCWYAMALERIARGAGDLRDVLIPGLRVRWKGRDASVVYIRHASGDGLAASIRLDDRGNDPAYTGTIVSAHDLDAPQLRHE